MKIVTLTDPPDWFKDGTLVDDPDTLYWVNISARWYLGIARQHGYAGVEDDRPLDNPQWEWRLCRVPVDQIWPETFSRQEEARLNSIRTENPDNLFPIIVELLDDGKVRLLDGSHRVTIARERITARIYAYVGNPQ